VVLICVLVGAGLFAAWGVSRASDVGYAAVAKIRVADTSVPNMPTLDTVTAFANSAKLKAAVEASAGLDPRGVRVTGAQDPKDKRGILITAVAPTAEDAAKWADAAAEQTRANALEMLAAPTGLEESRGKRFEARAAALEKEIAAMRTAALRVKDPQVQADYLVSAQTLEEQLATVLDSLDVSRYALEGYRSWIMVTPASNASKQSSQGVVLSDVLRGALVGLFVGVVIAALLENRRSNSRA
jgi:hypothetical protein